jgi:hypothetical protein
MHWPRRLLALALLAMNVALAPMARAQSDSIAVNGVALDAATIAALENAYQTPLAPVRGRNFDEILRVLDSMQLTGTHKVATPVNWRQGEEVIIAGSVSDDDAKRLFPEGWSAPKPYLRLVKQPRGSHAAPLAS